MTKRKIWSLMLILVLVVSTVSPAFGITLDRTNSLPAKITYAEPDEIVRVIVELEQAPILNRAATRGLSLEEIDANYVVDETDKLMDVQTEVREEIESISDEVTFRHAYVKSYNGFSADVNYSAIKEIEALDNVKSVHIANRYEKPEPQMLTSGGMVNVSSMWDIGYKGEGMLVAVLDTGIDYQHNDFVLTNPANGKLDLADVTTILANNELAVEAFAASESLSIAASDLYKSAKVPFAFDYADIDTVAKPDMSKPEASIHGVHVSGTVGANGYIKGIAPEAQIAAMKIFSDESPYAYEDDIVAGIEDAILIGADVINMSLGSTAGFTDDNDPEQQAIAIAKEAGVIVSVSAGNSAKFGAGYGYPLNATWTWNPDTGLLGSPSAGKGTFSVASIENIMAMSPYVLSSTAVKMQYTAAGNADPTTVFNAGSVEYVVCGFGTPADFTGKVLTGKIALISRGSIPFADKISTAAAAGAAGVIVYNNAGNSMISMAYPAGVTIPAIFIGQTNGTALVNAATKTVSFDPAFVDSFANPTAGQMSDFSSWGPTPSLEFKPEITAPGGDIYSTVNDNKYESMSGTSMSAPHIAGASAIMLEYVRDAFPGLTASEQGKFAKALMMSTAVPVTTGGTEYSPRQQGAGMLDLEAAVNTDVYAYSTLSPNDAKLALGEINPVFSFDVTLKNFGSSNHEFAVNVSSLTDNFGTLYGLPANVGSPVDLDGAVITVSSTHAQVAEITTVGVYAIAPEITPSSINVFNAIDSMSTTDAPVVIIPVAAGSTETVTVNVDLSGISQDVLDVYFNGFFADGFVQFLNISEADDNPDINIPYMGFVGEWEDAPVFDDDIYTGPDYSYYYPQFQSMISVVDLGGGVYDGIFLGKNAVDSSASYSNIAFSPNNDGSNDNAALLLSMLRNIEKLSVFITDSDQNFLEYISLNEVAYLRKPFLSNGQFIPYEFPTPVNELSSLIWDGTINGQTAEEGQYNYVVKAEITGGFGVQYYAYPIVVDVTAPVVTHKALQNGKLVVDAYDNHSIMSYDILDSNNQLIASSATNTITLPTTNLENHKLVVTDYAGNFVIVDAKPETRPGDVEIPVTPTIPPVTPTTPGTPTTPPADPKPVEVPVNESGEGSVVAIPEETVSKQISATAGSEVVLSLPKSLDVDKPLEISIPAESFKDLLEAGKDLVIQGEELTLKLNGNLTDLSSASSVKFTMEPVTVDDYDVSSEFKPLGIVYDFDILVDGKKLETFKSKPEITLTLPAGTSSPESVGAYVQNDDGTWSYVMSFYDEDTNSIRFKAPHFSKYALMSFSKTFDDIKSHWAKQSIEEMASKHIINGINESTFAPSKNVTRAEFIAMILRAMGESAEGSSSFVDVKNTDWYSGYFAKAEALDLVNANADGTINPLELITREEIATITAKAHALINNIKLTDKTPSITFKDANVVSSKNAKYVGYVQSKGIIVGYNNMFRPTDLTTRAEAVTIIKSMLDKK